MTIDNPALAKYSAFKDKKFLVVDDFQEFRTAIKRMVEAFGAVDVDTASDGEDAIEQIKQKMYDVILCDYNLGNGKDGQQVLEEGKYSKAINEAQIFILLTAENTADMVMGALEYEPDTYLIKPFTKEMVYERLIKCIEQKQALMEIYKSLEGADPENAIKICDKIISSGGKYVLPCIKIKVRELIKLKKYKEASLIYQMLLDARDLSWALLGLGKCYFYLEKYDEAKAKFELLLEDNASCVEAMDWIAKIHLIKGDKLASQKILEKAATISSKSIIRQQNLADIAYDNQDLLISERAYKAATDLGKHSCYRRDHDYYRFAEVLYKKSIEEDNPAAKIRYEAEAGLAVQSIIHFNAKNKKSLLDPYIFLLKKQISFDKHQQALKTLNKIIGVINTDDTAAKPILEELQIYLNATSDKSFIKAAEDIKNKIGAK